MLLLVKFGDRDLAVLRTPVLWWGEGASAISTVRRVGCDGFPDKIHVDLWTDKEERQALERAPPRIVLQPQYVRICTPRSVHPGVCDRTPTWVDHDVVQGQRSEILRRPASKLGHSISYSSQTFHVRRVTGTVSHICGTVTPYPQPHEARF